ncbi:MAG: MFS transporter [Oscillospiraceae bacterium]|nr:MFS transporter [Oscillospiraceae bacterium]
MTKERTSALQIERRYAVLQSSSCVADCTTYGLASIFLTYCGLSNTSIGYTTAAAAILSIIMQLTISNYSDHHAAMPIRRIAAAMNLLLAVCSAILAPMLLPAVLMASVFAVAMATDCSLYSINNALMMQYMNVGIPVRYGWPRGVGSLCYALAAYILGLAIDCWSPALLMKGCLAFSAAAFAASLWMPDPTRCAGRPLQATQKTHTTTTVQMLRGNRPLALFLLACILVGSGQSVCSLFLVRVVENLGGTGSQVGIAMLIQSGVELPAMCLSPLLLRKFRPGKLLAISFSCYAVKILLIALCGNLTMLFVIMFFSIFCFGIYGVASVLFVNEIVGADEKTRAQSLVNLCFMRGIGGIIGNACSGILLDQVGLHSLLYICFAVSAAGALLFIFSVSHYGKRQYRERHLSMEG